MRARNIKPGFFKDEELADIPISDRFQARYLFAGLWCMADCEGRLEDKTKTIKVEVFGHDEEIGAAKVHFLLQILHDRGLIVRYAANDKKYIQVRNFKKHQNPHMNEVRKGSELPCPQQDDLVRYKNGTGTIPAPDSHQTDTRPVGMIPDSRFLIPDSLIPETGNPVSLPVVVIQSHQEPDYFPMFWGLFEAAGLPLNDRDKERTLRLWLNHDPPAQKRIISWVIEQLKTTWCDAKHTMRPYNALESEGWTRVASERVIPDPGDSTQALILYMKQQRAKGLR